MTNRTSYNKKRRRRRKSFLSVILTIVIIAVVCVAAVLIGIHFSGVRYMKVKISETSYVKFFGTVDKENKPYKGRILYSDGLSAELNLEFNQISYSNGDLYEGEFENLMKDGEGKITYGNGDVYEGEFDSDCISGKGKY